MHLHNMKGAIYYGERKVLYLQACFHCVYGVYEALRHCACCCARYDMPDLRSQQMR